MSGPKKSLLIRLVSQNAFAQDVTAFLIDRQARGLSPRTVGFYRDELRYLLTYLEGQGVTEVLQVTPNLLRKYLLSWESIGTPAVCTQRTARSRSSSDGMRPRWNRMAGKTRYTK